MEQKFTILELVKKLERAIRAAENKEWREGRRCDICGDEKEPNLSSMCDDCLETQ